VRRCTPYRSANPRIDNDSSNRLSRRIASNSSTFDLTLPAHLHALDDTVVATVQVGPDQTVITSPACRAVGPNQAVTPRPHQHQHQHQVEPKQAAQVGPNQPDRLRAVSVARATGTAAAVLIRAANSCSAAQSRLTPVELTPSSPIRVSQSVATPAVTGWPPIHSDQKVFTPRPRTPSPAHSPTAESACASHRR
jgi:hypothetical protein